MSRRVNKNQPSLVDQQQPLLGGKEISSSIESTCNPCSSCGKGHFGEVIGGATAECAAICCCCPCGLVNLLVLAVYKLPAGICRKALRMKRRRRLLKNGKAMHAHPRCDCDELEVDLCRGDLVNLDEEVVALEEEMWAKFYHGGFWRSPSQSQISDNHDLSILDCKK